MNSISEDCTKMKNDYEACFNQWFSTVFLQNLQKSDETPCKDLFDEYRACLMIAVKEKQLDKLIAEARQKQPFTDGGRDAER